MDYRQEAKKLGINSFGKTKEVVLAEIEAMKPNAPSEKSDAAPVIEGGSISDARKRAEKILKDREGRGVNYGERPSRFPKVNTPPGYVDRWVNEDKIKIRENRGYEVVEGQDVVITDRRGGKTHLMRIPKEIYDLDQAAKQKQVDQVEESILRKEVKDGNSAIDKGKVYGQVTIERN